jgi:hypothetical protein
MKKAITFIFCALLQNPEAYASIYSEDFETFTPGAVTGQDGWAGNGTVVEGSIGGGPGAQMLDLGASSTFNTRSISGITGGDIYYGFTVDINNLPLGPTANETFFRLNGWSTFIALKAAGVNTVEVDLGGGGATVVAAPEIVDGSQHRVVGKLTWGGSSFTQHQVFLNPVGLEGDNTAIASNLGTDALGAITFEIRNDDVSTNVDDLVFTTSWAEAIPEPGMVGLLGVGFVMVMWYRRRKS